MVDVSAKAVTERVAQRRRPYSWRCSRPRSREIRSPATMPKGDVLAVARVAGIQAAKRTSDLIPLCHPLPLTRASVDFEAVQPDAKLQASPRPAKVTGAAPAWRWKPSPRRASRRSRCMTCARPSTAACASRAVELLSKDRRAERRLAAMKVHVSVLRFAAARAVGDRRPRRGVCRPGRHAQGRVCAQRWRVNCPATAAAAALGDAMKCGWR